MLNIRDILKNNKADMILPAILAVSLICGIFIILGIHLNETRNIKKAAVEQAKYSQLGRKKRFRICF